jgi:hypothetical protein
MMRPESQAIVPMIEEAVVRQDALAMNLLIVDDEQYVRQLSQQWEARSDPVQET